MAAVTVYQFRVYDVTSDELRLSRRFATREAIHVIAHGQVLEGTATSVDERAIGADIPGMTAIDYQPPCKQRIGFQRQVS